MRFLLLLCKLICAGVPFNAEFTKVEIKINGKEKAVKGTPTKYFYQTILIERRS